MKDKFKLPIPQYVKNVLCKLIKNGHSAYLVGGCVRDLLMGRRPADYDIATSAYPEAVIKLFRKVYKTGLEHGTVTVVKNGHHLEVTTLRKDGMYSDARRPDSVSFSTDILSDLSRRDFTINAMAWSEESGLIDPFSARKDLSRKQIKCVGDPYERFYEDPLRILRAWRFASILGFTIEPDTVKAALSLRERLNLVSAERIQAEIVRMMLSKNIGVLNDLIRSGFLERFGLRSAPDMLMRLSKIRKDLRLRTVVFATVLEQNGDIENAETFLKAMKFDRKTISLLRKVLDSKVSFRCPLMLKKGISEYGYEVMLCAASVHYIKTGENVSSRISEIKKSGDCTSMRELQIDGEKLKEIGITDGMEIGRILKKLLEYVLIHPEDNQTEKLTNLAKNME